jgi:hypothetical protein
VPRCGALQYFAVAATVEVAEEVITKVNVIFVHPRTLKDFLGHFIARMPRFSDDTQLDFSQRTSE